MDCPTDNTALAAGCDTAADPEVPDLCLTIVEEAGDWRGGDSLRAAIRNAVEAVARAPAGRKARACELCVVLANDTVQRRLNGAYRGKDAPTNVLSFPFEPRAAADRTDRGYLGDIVLAEETIRREAADAGLDMASHVQHLVVHGLLHLLGYDHETEAEADSMERLEAEILATLGVENPYDRDVQDAK